MTIMCTIQYGQTESKPDNRKKLLLVRVCSLLHGEMRNGNWVFLDNMKYIKGHAVTEKGIITKCAALQARYN